MFSMSRLLSAELLTVLSVLDAVEVTELRLTQDTEWLPNWSRNCSHVVVERGGELITELSDNEYQQSRGPRDLSMLTSEIEAEMNSLRTERQRIGRVDVNAIDLDQTRDCVSFKSAVKRICSSGRTWQDGSNRMIARRATAAVMRTESSF